MDHEITEEFTNSDIIPSAGQGTIAVQCRDDDHEINEFLKKINHHETSLKVKAEREVLKVLDGDCETAIGVYSNIKEDIIELKAELFSLDGNEKFYVQSSKKISQADELGLEVGEDLKKQSKGNYKK